MTRVSRLLASLAVLLIGLACTRGRRDSPRVPRDVVLVTIDTLRFDAVGFDGNPRGTTPHLDRFATAGRVFLRAHAHNLLTLPSHTNILTGLYPYQHGVRDNVGFRLDQKTPTAATILSEKGYTTGAFIAAFPLDSRYGLSRGFETYDELYRHVDEPEEFDIEQSRAGEVVAAAVAWFRAHAGKPRFLWIHLYDPHAPYDPPEEFRQRFPSDPYLGEVAFTDTALSPLLDEIEATHPAPFLIVTADHGEARGDHGELTHGLFAYEPTLHVPLLIWCPDLVATGRETTPVRHVDLLTTILDAVGDTGDRKLPGKSLLSRAPQLQDISYFESLSANFNRGWAPLRGLIRSEEKYIDLPIPELYDLGKDPEEKVNLIASSSDAVRALRKELLAIPAGPTTPGSVASEEAAKLKSLGYLAGSSSPKASYGPEDDPKNLVQVDHALHEMVDRVERGDRAGALTLARQIVADNPKMRMGYEHLAVLLRDSGDLAGALKVYERAAASGVGGESMDRRRALILCEMRRPDQAIALLAPYRESSDTETLNALGIALSDSGHGRQSLAVFGRVLEIDPNNALGYQNTGIALLKLDQVAQARENLQKALAIHERNPRAWNALGVAWMRLSEPQKALDAWDKAVAYNPKQYDALYNLGLVAVRTGDKTRARKALQRFVDTAPPRQYSWDIAEARNALETLKKTP